VPPYDPRVRSVVLIAVLAACGDEAREPTRLSRLRAGLADPGRVEAAAKALGAMGPKAAEAVPDLIEALWEGDAGHRAICLALGDIGARPDLTVPVLVKVLHHESMELAGITALARFGPGAEAALPALEKRADHPDPTTRYAVAEARWRITGDPQHVVARLRDSSEKVRFDAVWGLAEAGERAALERAVTDEDAFPDVRRQAREALRN